MNGTTKIIHRTGGELQLGVELLAQLDDTILGAIVGGILTDVPNAVVLADDIGGLGAAEVDHSAVDRDGGTLGGILDHGGLEGVEHHLSGLLTGEVVLGVEVALLIANENADGVHDFHSFIVVDLVGIFESCVADGDEGHGHDQRQHQSE